MRPEDAEKLLGGYATGTLTEAERQTLFEAALANQDLFNALADEEALRELLADPAARRRLLEQLAEKKPLSQLLFGWWNRRLAWGMAGSAVVTVLIVAVLVPVYRRLAPEHFAPAPLAQVEMAQKIAPPTPAPQVTRRLAPVVPKAQAPAAHRARIEAEVVGGTPGGVIGGVSGGAIQAPPATAAEVRESTAAVAESKKLAVSAFRSQAPPPASLGLHYTILKRDSAGRYAEVAPDAVFQRGDSVRLSVEASQGGTLQLLAQDPAGAWHVVQQVTLVPRSRQVLPAEDAPALSGPQRLRLVFSAAPAEKGKLRDQAASTPAVQSVDIELRRQ